LPPLHAWHCELQISCEATSHNEVADPIYGHTSHELALEYHPPVQRKSPVSQVWPALSVTAKAISLLQPLRNLSNARSPQVVREVAGHMVECLDDKVGAIHLASAELSRARAAEK